MRAVRIAGPRRLSQEARRVLRPGGLLACSDLYRRGEENVLAPQLAGCASGPVPVRAGRRCAKGRASPSGISRMPARPWPVWRGAGLVWRQAEPAGMGLCGPGCGGRHPGPAMRSGSRKRRNDASPDDGSFAAGAAGLLLQPAAGAASGAGPGQGSSGSGAGPARSLSRHRPVRRALRPAHGRCLCAKPCWRAKARKARSPIPCWPPAQ